MSDLILAPATAPTTVLPAAAPAEKIAPQPQQKTPDAAPKVRKPRLLVPAILFVLSFIIPQVVMGAVNPGDNLMLALLINMVGGFLMNALSLTFSGWLILNIFRRVKAAADSDKVRAALRTAQQFKK